MARVLLNALRCGWLIALLTVGPATSLCGQETHPLPSRDDAWLASRDAMRAALRRLGNLTCIQNIRREAQRSGGPGRSAGPREDFVRLQVSIMEGKEYYSYPGDDNAMTTPHLLVKTGLSGTGVFFGYARTVFERHPFSVLRLVGRESWQGRPALRFRFEFDEMRERLDITRAGRTASVGARGEFVVDEADSLLRLLTIRSLGSVPELGIERVEYDVFWSIVQPADASQARDPLLIPERAEMRMVLFTGEVQKNEIQLTQCREFRVETALRFDENEPVVEASSDEGTSGQVIRLAGPSVLPEGGALQLALETPVDLAKSAVGDALRARLTQAVPLPGGPTLPEGAVAELRIRRLERVREPELHAVVWIELSALRVDDKVYLGLAQLERSDRVRGMVDRLEKKTQVAASTMWDQTRAIDSVLEEVIYPSIPGVGAFLFRGEPGAFPAGFKMTWKTLPPRASQP
ncbi:MAG: hypothetical protein KIT83_22040 [Bryobacterales bacterium]|nr:hypothetical protein [Bryobacterales bacterium]